MENQDLVTVYSVSNPAEAEIVRSALESVGISCVIGGEMQGGFTGTFEIDILAPAADADRARKELRMLRKEKKERHQARMDEAKEEEPETGIQE
jgi:phage tail tape-measure protein